MSTLLTALKQRKTALGISYPDLSARSGVSVATVKRIFAGQAAVSLPNVDAVMAAMGLAYSIRETAPAKQFKAQAAREQAESIVREVQGTSALEDQAVDAKLIKQVIRDSTKRLLAGSPRRIWAQ